MKIGFRTIAKEDKEYNNINCMIIELNPTKNLELKTQEQDGVKRLLIIEEQISERK